MAKEATYSPYPNLVFRETFRDEAAVRKNGGTPTNVDFSNGVGSFNGTSSSIVYKNIIAPSAITFRVRTKISETDNITLLSSGPNLESGWRFDTLSGEIRFVNYDTSVTLTSSYSGLDDGLFHELVMTYENGSQALYIDGVSVDTISSATDFSWTQIATYGLEVGSLAGGTVRLWDSDVDLVEVYNKALTASEVANLDNNSWNKEQNFGGGFSSQLLLNNTFQNWTADNPDDWTISGIEDANNFVTRDANGCRIVSNGSLIGITQDVLTLGKRYKVRIDVIVVSGGGIYVRVGDSGLSEFYINSTGVYEFEEECRGNSTLAIRRNVATEAIVTSITVREIKPKTLIDFDSVGGVIRDRTVGNVVGDRVLTNDDFQNSTGWTLDSNASITGGKLVLSNSSRLTYQSKSESGKKYRVVINVTSLSIGSFKIYTGGNQSEIISSTGVKVIEITGGSSDSILGINPTSCTCSIDYIYVYEVRDDLSITDVTAKKQGAEFNGSSSKIDIGVDMIGTKAITIMGWIKPYSFGEVTGNILNNSKCILQLNDSGAINPRLRFNSDGITDVYNDINSVLLNKFTCIIITRNSDGIVNFYIGDKKTAPTLSGTANQNSGTPTDVGATNTIIGNNDGQTRTFDGLIPKLKVVEGILSLEEITQYWSDTRKWV